MRLVALGQARAPAFTVRGSLVVAAAGTVVGILAGLLYGLARPYLPGRGLVQGLGFAVLLQLVIWPIGFPLPIVPPHGRFEAGDTVARIAFVLLGLVAGVALEWVFARVDRPGTTAVNAVTFSPGSS